MSAISSGKEFLHRFVVEYDVGGRKMYWSHEDYNAALQVYRHTCLKYRTRFLDFYQVVVLEEGGP